MTNSISTLYADASRLLQQGQHAEAMAACQRILRDEPRHANALMLLAVLTAQQGKVQAAIGLLREAAAIDPQHAEIQNNLGALLNGQRQFELAVPPLERAVALRPDYREAHFNLGSALNELGQCGMAVHHFSRAGQLGMDSSAYHYNYGIALQQSGRWQDAIDAYDKAIALDPAQGGAYSNKGLILSSFRHFEAAVATYEKAVAANPADPKFHNNLASALQELGRLDAALDSYERALALWPAYAYAHNNIGTLLQNMGRHEQARPHFEQAMALDADYVEARWNMALWLLQQGDFEAGWPAYECRWRRSQAVLAERNFGVPQWTGNQPLDGKTIILHAEQGLGDTLQFCRYAPALAARGATVVLEVQPALKHFLQHQFEHVSVIGHGESHPAPDLHCPLMSLPLGFGTRPDTVPAPAQYLSCEPGQLVKWRAQLGQGGAPQVGLVWRGSAAHRADRDRSLSLAQLLAQLPAGPRYFSLQKDISDSDRQLLQSRTDIVHLGDALHDFSDTAAVCAALDLVVTVDTSVAHLAGALGCPVWILLAVQPDWRWMLGRRDSPWYDSAVLYRQTAPGNWLPVLQQLAGDLGRLATAGAGATT
jgi:tetratricopeptide (TPR) repeat protein